MKTFLNIVIGIGVLAITILGLIIAFFYSLSASGVNPFE